MHDPKVLAFEIKRPWPRHKDKLSNRRYWPPMVTVWHKEPGGKDAFTVCGPAYSLKWRWHVHHWRIQLPPLLTVRRYLLTRCAWCGGPSRRGDRVNVSHTRDGLKSPWYKGERGLFHMVCSSIEHAHRSCTCAIPQTEHSGYGRCVRCGLYRGYGMKDEIITRQRELKSIPKGMRK